MMMIIQMGSSILCFKPKLLGRFNEREKYYELFGETQHFTFFLKHSKIVSKIIKQCKPLNTSRFYCICFSFKLIVFFLHDFPETSLIFMHAHIHKGDSN